jgi:hypothetical protein
MAFSGFHAPAWEGMKDAPTSSFSYKSIGYGLPKIVDKKAIMINTMEHIQQLTAIGDKINVLGDQTI